MIEELADRLAEEDIGILEEDLFIGELPLGSQDCVAVISAPSPAPHKTFDVYTQDVDFWARFNNSKQAYDKLKAIRDLFNREYAYEFENYYIYFSHALTAIDDMGRDSERRKMYKLSVRFIYRPIILS